MPNKSCFLPRSIRLDKTVQKFSSWLARFDLDRKGLTMLISGCGQSFCTCATVPYRFNSSGYATGSVKAQKLAIPVNEDTPLCRKVD